MKDIVKDKVRFRSPDGGDIELTFSNYRPEEVQIMRLQMEANGWTFEAQTTTNEKPLPVPAWVLPWLVGFAFSGVLFIYLLT
jgi:hypothetical protein